MMQADDDGPLVRHCIKVLNEGFVRLCEMHGVDWEASRNEPYQEKIRRYREAQAKMRGVSDEEGNECGDGEDGYGKDPADPCKDRSA